MEQHKEIGPYVIDSEIGRGGMGVVYLAHDSRLDRRVAIKALPDLLAEDPDRLARFDREARTLASLNHPNVAGIHGLESHDGKKYLVLEYVEGETLADRLDRGPLPIDEALETCIEIARGLEAAHDAGIIHRDLKPANIKITPEGKAVVLDFGLAKATDENAGSTILTQSAITLPTTPNSPTVPGAILGTAPYMSPEQARGRSVDKRSDVWSFAIIVYECLTGVGPFVGETITDSIGAILHKNVDLATLPPGTPAQVHRVLRRCLERDRNKRLRDIGDARLELEDALREPEADRIAAPATRERAGVASRIAWPLVAILAVVAAFAAWNAWFKPAPAPAPIRFTAELGAEDPIETGAGPHIALSPDGTTLVFLAGASETLHLRRIDRLQAEPLKGTEDAAHPFWSPDGQWIGFFQDNKIKKISVSGGAPLTLCDASGAHRGATWSDKDTIVFAPSTVTGLWRVPASGGAAEQITEPDREQKERSHRWPHALPGGTHVLFTSQSQGQDFDEATIEAIDLRTLERTVIHRGGAFPIYTASGHLLFGRQATLYAAPFNPRTLELLTPPEPVLAGVSTEPSNGAVHVTVSDNGTLVYNTGEATAFQNRIFSLDREGNATPVDPELRGYVTAAVSPGGDRLAVQLVPEGQTSFDVWVYEIERQILSRLTFGEGDEMSPVWSPDGNWIAYCDTGDGFAPNIFIKRADGAGEPRRLTESLNAQFPVSWSQEANAIAFQEDVGETSWDILTLDPDDENATPEVFIRTPFMEGDPVFSPDGRWLAYSSNESGQFEVYVRSYPGPGGRWQVSSDGGGKPVWSPKGDEIFYLWNSSVYAAPVTATDNALRVGRPIKLHDNGPPATFFRPQFDVMPDGETFIALKPESDDDEIPQTTLEFVLNWFTELNEKAPRR